LRTSRSHRGLDFERDWQVNPRLYPRGEGPERTSEMPPISYKRHWFPPGVIRHVVWLYFRFSLSLRDAEDLLAERATEVTHETSRCRTQRFDPGFTRNLRRCRPRPTTASHLDEIVVNIAGRRMSRSGQRGLRVRLTAMAYNPRRGPA